MESHLKVLIITSAIFLLIHQGESIDCYQCVSMNTTDESGQACRQPFDQWNVPYIKKCRQHIAGHSQEAFACVKIVQTIEETGQETVIRDCIAVPMKQGCEKRIMSNYKLYAGPAHTMVQCVYVCHENNGCNHVSSLDLHIFCKAMQMALLFAFLIGKFSKNQLNTAQIS